mgnify:CR=1 FL=1
MAFATNAEITEISQLSVGPPLTEDVLSDLRKGFERLWLGIRLIVWLLYPFSIISPVLRYIIKKQTDAHQYNEVRFQSFAKKFSAMAYALLEVASFLQYEGDPYLLAAMGVCCAIFTVIIWQYPEQLVNLSVLPDALVMPLLDKLSFIKHFLSRRRKGYEVGIIEGDKLSVEARQRLGIDKDTFVCGRCKVKKSVADSWGGRVSTRTGVVHLCTDCLDGALTLRRPTLDRWIKE